MVNAVRHGLHLPQLGRVPQCGGAPLPARNARQALSGHVVFVAVAHAAPESIKIARRVHQSHLCFLNAGADASIDFERTTADPPITLLFRLEGGGCNTTIEL